ncbi:histidine kinase [Leptospira sp. 201903070]|uniref:Histidine kinase n=1 Tax=Leptospira ainlahdjerensis TaxID=2810033 RepID=A0ABS2UA99_9LEPT|nr:histidine kinase [Leptospira ainlahdjerensis]MBM9576868.1 histidine kinase [Leptospira ainlahdjerensis]
MGKNRILFFLLSDYRGLLLLSCIFCFLLGSGLYISVNHPLEVYSKISIFLIVFILYCQYLGVCLFCRVLLLKKNQEDLNFPTEPTIHLPKEKKVFVGSQIYNLRMTPHFLFNSLMTLRIRMESYREGAIEYLDSLANMLRYSFRFAEEERVSLREELDFTLSYFDLVKNKAKAPFRIILRKEVDVEIDEVYIPPFLIQTLVENSVKHAVLKSKESIVIEVEIGKTRSDYIRIVVKDNGPGAAIVDDFTKGTFFYLRRRLNEICLDADLRIHSEIGNGFKTEISFYVESSERKRKSGLY